MKDLRTMVKLPAVLAPPDWAVFCLLAGHQVTMAQNPAGKVAWVCHSCGGGGRCDECGKPR